MMCIYMKYLPTHAVNCCLSPCTGPHTISIKIHVDVLDTETDKSCLGTRTGQPNNKVQSLSDSDHFRSQIFKSPLSHIISVAFDHESGRWLSRAIRYYQVSCYKVLMLKTAQ